MMVCTVTLDNAGAEHLLHLIIRIQISCLDRQDTASGGNGNTRTSDHFRILVGHQLVTHFKYVSKLDHTALLGLGLGKSPEVQEKAKNISNKREITSVASGI